MRSQGCRKHSAKSLHRPLSRGCLHIPRALHPFSCDRAASIPWSYFPGRSAGNAAAKIELAAWPTPPLPIKPQYFNPPRSQGSLRLSSPDPGLVRQQSAPSTATGCERRGCCGSGQHRQQKNPELNSPTDSPTCRDIKSRGSVLLGVGRCSPFQPARRVPSCGRRKD